MSSQNTVTELKEIAKSLGLKGYTGLRKRELIELINSQKQTEPKYIPPRVKAPATKAEYIPPRVKAPATKAEYIPPRVKTPTTKILTQTISSPQVKSIQPPLPARPPKVQLSGEKVPSPKPVPAKVPSPKIESKKLSGDFELILHFRTTTDNITDPDVQIIIPFNENSVYIPKNEGFTNFESGAFFHLIKRASDRLAINTTNTSLQKNVTELISVSASVLDTNGKYQEIEVIPLDEIRQYTSSEKVKATLKAGLAGAVAPVAAGLNAVKGGLVGGVLGGGAVGFLGGVGGKKVLGASGALVGGAVGVGVGAGYYAVVGTLGGAVGGVKGTFQTILGDEYLQEKDRKLHQGTYLSSDGEYLVADVPFHLVINDLIFPKSFETNEIYTLSITGKFIGVHVQNRLKGISHADTSTMQITKAELLSSKDNKTDVKKILKDCKSNPECIYFAPEV